MVGRRRRSAWPQLSLTQSISELKILGKSHRAVWTKTVDEMRLKATSSGEFQGPRGWVVRNSWSLRKNSCTE